MGNSGLIRRDFNNPLLTAISGIINADLPDDLSGDPVPICTYVVKDTPFPYITIGETELVDLWDCKDEAGEQVLVTVRVWTSQSIHGGPENANLIAGQLLTTLTTTDPDLTGDGFRVGHYRLFGSNITIQEKNDISSRLIQIVYFITDTQTVQ